MLKKIVIPVCGICLFVIMVFTCSHVIAQEQVALLTEKFQLYQQQTLQEKLYVHTDKNFYLAGEICWFKIYSTDAFFNRPLDISKLAYVEILDKNNKPVLQAKLPLKKGDGSGSFQLPVSLGSGKYLFRAYTRWMKNFSAAYFFEKPITIVNTRRIADISARPKNKYDLQFFPEGGNLVTGIQSRIAFRVVDQNGTGISCAGVVVNEKADTVARYTALKFGMGSFHFLPEKGHVYKGVITLPDSSVLLQALPAAYDNGYCMQLAKDNQQLKITVQSTAASSATIYLFAHTRGAVKLVLSGELRNGIAEFLIDTARLGAGISHFTVFNADRQPVCERLFFKRPVKHLELTAIPDLTEYETRKKVMLRISSSGQDAGPLAADMSLAVYRVDSLTDPGGMDISSYCWLGSELIGGIESPGYYLNNQSPEAEEAIDNLMMTQGWRRFRWENILQNQKPVFEFEPEYKGHIVTGKVLNNASGQPVKGIESFLSVAGTKTIFRGTFSDDSGKVKFEMNNFYGDNEIIVQTNSQENGPRHIEIVNPFSGKYSGTLLPSLSFTEKNGGILTGRHAAVQIQNTYAGNKLKQYAAPDADTTPFYSMPDKTYLLDDYVRFTTVEEILREYVPEVNVRKREGKFFLPVFDNIRKEFFKVEPLILLDGVPVLDADKIMSYDPLKIRKMEVVARMYFYGNMFFDGIVNFITYRGDMPGYELDAHATVLDYETLQQQREFFSPVYDSPDQMRDRLPDFRNLLYWSPAVKTNADGKTAVGFYTSDITGRFAIVLEGLAADGKTGSHTVYFQVKDGAQAAEKLASH